MKKIFLLNTALWLCFLSSMPYDKHMCRVDLSSLSQQAGMPWAALCSCRWRMKQAAFGSRLHLHLSQLVFSKTPWGMEGDPSICLLLIALPVGLWGVSAPTRSACSSCQEAPIKRFFSFSFFCGPAGLMARACIWRSREVEKRGVVPQVMMVAAAGTEPESPEEGWVWGRFQAAFSCLVPISAIPMARWEVPSPSQMSTQGAAWVLQTTFSPGGKNVSMPSLLHPED